MYAWTHLESDLLRHTLSLVGQHDRVTVTTAFLARMLPQLKLLEGKSTSKQVRPAQQFHSLSPRDQCKRWTEGWN